MRNILIKSAIPLSLEQRKRIEGAFTAKYTKEQLNFKYTEERNLTGGLIIADGETVYDASAAKTLFEFRKRSEDYFNEKLGKNNRELPMMWKKELIGLLHTDASKINCGTVVASADGIITIDGLSDCRYFELLEIGKGGFAIAMNLMTDCVKAMLITRNTGIEFGSIVRCTGKTVEVPVGDELLGRVVNPLGKPVDGSKVLHFEKTRPIESPAPSIVDRQKVTRPIQTGILAIDSMIPIGKGQRELIIGDRQTGKTSIAVDAIINQRDKNVICIYVAIGQRASGVNRIVQKLKAANAMKNTVVVVSTADESAALQYISPYTGCAIGEEFMERGKDVLIVYDDLTKHANAYRTISLLLKRPSGREAYPGDVFYIHSRLLERSSQLKPEMGGGSMTAMPIIETLAGDISQYIPTNVISITDGQIYLESELFNAGIRPAVNVGLSVSRVGGSAQYPAMRKLASQLRLDLAHFRELALFSQFGAEVDDSTKAVLEQGEKVTELLKQGEGDPMSVDKEIIFLYIIGNHIKKVPMKYVREYLEGFYHYFVNSNYSDTKELRKKGILTDAIKTVVENEILLFDAYFFNEHRKAECRV